MKNTVLFLTALLLTISWMVRSQEKEINLTIKLNGEFKPDTIYVVLYPATNKVDGKPFPDPLVKLPLTEWSASFSADPGTFYFGVMALGYKTLMTPLIIPGEADEYWMNVVMNPEIIGWGGITSVSGIQKVTVRGDFNRFKENNEIPLIRYGDLWKPEQKSPLLEEGKRYSFYVNGQETIDLLNSRAAPSFPWLAMKSIYVNNDLVFDPSFYSLVYKESELEVPWRNIQTEYVKIVTRVSKMKKESDGKFTGHSDISAEDWKTLISSSLSGLLSGLKEMEEQSDPLYRQFFLAERLKTLTTYFFLSSPEQPCGTKKITDEHKVFFQSEKFRQIISEVKDHLVLLDPASLFQGEPDKLLAMALVTFNNFIVSFPEIAGDLGFKKDYFLDFLRAYTGKMVNKRLAVQMLFDYITVIGFYVAYDLCGEEERIGAEELYRYLKSDFPWEKQIPAEVMERMYELVKPK